MSSTADTNAVLDAASAFETKYKDEIKAKVAAGLSLEQAREVIKAQVRYDATLSKPEEKSPKGK